MKYILYIKESPSGLKYLGKFTYNETYEYRTVDKYTGSGMYWKRHLKANGFSIKDIKTTVLFETTDKIELKEKGIYYSKLYNIVDSKEFANLTEEQGFGGITGVGEKHHHYGKKDPTSSKRMKENNPMHNPEVASKNPTKFKKGQIKPERSGMKARPVAQIDDVTKKIIKTYKSISEASRSTGIFLTCIWKCCKGHKKQPRAGGFIWKYI